jgi:hypothetical protein
LNAIRQCHFGPQGISDFDGQQLGFGAGVVPEIDGLPKDFANRPYGQNGSKNYRLHGI